MCRRRPLQHRAKFGLDLRLTSNFEAIQPSTAGTEVSALWASPDDRLRIIGVEQQCLPKVCLRDSLPLDFLLFPSSALEDQIKQRRIRVWA